MAKILIKHGNIIKEGSVLKDTAVLIEGPKIKAVGRAAGAPHNADTIDARGLFLSPGFIDTHIHGSPRDITKNETKYGTTSFVVAVSCGRPIPDISGQPAFLGVRLEGPYISPLMAGAQDKRAIRRPSQKSLSAIIGKCGKKLKMMTLAPELPGAGPIIRLCKKHGIIPSIGHTSATYEASKKSFGKGIRHATHLFNAMSGPRHGTAGAGLAALFDKRVTVEVIADLKHVRQELLRLVFAVKNTGGIILVTDSVRARSSGHKKGSRVYMINAVANVVKHCGVALPDAVKMASANPAKLLGLSRRKGSITPGKDADLVAFDKNFNVKFTIIGGRMVYQERGLK